MIFRYFKNSRSNKSFTLIELLIVIAILALLMSIIIITLNPSEMLKKSRDTKRISNVKSINTALGIFQATRPTASTGTANIVYVSIPDSSSTCANLGLPSLPTGYTYQCSTTANYRKTDGTGWIPVNFNSLDIGSPISSLPIDPTNTTSTGLYFTYVTGGSWELTSQFESTSYSEQASIDGGVDPASFEFGTDLTLSPFTHGLVGYWKFDETGTSVLDSSGFNNTGTIYSSTTATDLHTTSCKSGGCINFDFIDDIITTTNKYIPSSYGFEEKGLTLMAWIYSDINANTARSVLVQSYGQHSWGSFGLWIFNSKIYMSTYSPANGAYRQTSGNTTISSGQWYHFAGVMDPINNKILVYINGQLDTSSPTNWIDSDRMESSAGSYGYFDIAGQTYSSERPSKYWDGKIDNARIYSRALSAQEILNIYNSGQ
jgi:prepilin-type N-terminal cleavage/methylation domain-containing protein